MLDLRKSMLLSSVLSIALSFAAGYFYAGNGWHNGPAFLLMFVILMFFCRTEPGAGTTGAIRLLGPTLLLAIFVAVLSVVGIACGIATAGKDLSFGDLPYYLIAVLFCGISVAAVNVYCASRERSEMMLGPVFIKIVLGFILFIAGIVTVAYDAGPRVYVAAGYAVFCILVSVVFLWRSTLAAYS